MRRYKAWRSRSDPDLHVICVEGAEAFEALPNRIRSLGPWTGSREGEISALKFAYRYLLVEQDFAIVHKHVSKFGPEFKRETAIGTEPCPDCNGSGNVPMHGGLRQKDCPRCGGRGWIGK